MAVLDSTTLLYLFEPEAAAPSNPETREPVIDAGPRIEHLVQSLEKQDEVIVIPTPVLSEILVHAGDAGGEYLETLNNSSRFRIAPFDQLAAVELAAMTRDALSTGDLRAGTGATRAKLKFDRQIIAIARTQGQTTIYSDDGDIATLASPLGLEVIPIYRLPEPPASQSEIFSSE